MKKKMPVVEKLPSSPTHWTATVSCSCSVGITLIFLVQWLIRLLWYDLPFSLIQFLRQLTEPMPWPWPLFPLLPQLAFVVILFLFGSIALVFSVRQQWRKGVGRAIIGVALPAIILMFYTAFYSYEVSCCLR